MPKVFTPAQLEPHITWWARLWHQARRGLGLGWLTLVPAVAFTGRILRGETDADGDTSFDLSVLPDLVLHCEVDPDDLETLRPILATLDVNQVVTIYGRFVVDLSHAQLELHPVVRIVV